MQPDDVESHRNVIVLDGKVNNMAVPQLTLEFASVCLNNAFTILNLAMNETNETTSDDAQVLAVDILELSVVAG